MKSDFIPPIREATFKLWLAKQDPDYVGESSSGESCPLALWLCDSGAGVVHVNGLRVNKWHAPVRRLPAWATAFVEGVDSVGRAKSPDGWGAPITRAEAFEILEMVHAGAWQ